MGQVHLSRELVNGPDWHLSLHVKVSKDLKADELPALPQTGIRPTQGPYAERIHIRFLLGAKAILSNVRSSVSSPGSGIIGLDFHVQQNFSRVVLEGIGGRIPGGHLISVTACLGLPLDRCILQ